MRNEVKVGKKLDVWSVAAALLIQENGASLHYETITRRVLESGLTTLGEKGDTPAQTVGSILRKACDGINAFESIGKGDYTIVNEEQVRQLSQVQEALARLAAR